MTVGDRWHGLTPSDVRTAVFFTLLVSALAAVLAILWLRPGPVPEEAPSVRHLFRSADPAQAAFVTSRVRDDGRVEVTQGLWSSTPRATVVVSLPQTSLPPGPVAATGVRATTLGGDPLAGPVDVRSSPVTVHLGRAVRGVRLQYVLEGVVDASATVPGRVLAGATSLDVDADWRQVPVTVRVLGGTVLDLGCSDLGPGAVPHACGGPDGAGWKVTLPADASDRLVIAQLDLPALAGNAG